ncbi:uncharacterized protein NDAI_0K00550 [Naumovozyma dairenensis CBS 421]|uniref:Uncharacterized protein n=1 Tax=Naumovozyma dairenensis (strain ATCC 10597 / BCRC 20456 / CBS 421 / NBRC 0211 / NRRL Y-12639) TaxID=1071378 RepID=G0WHI5_NAUDC|nr:hypothetical protein NDAI_0K00550 [Naumovozyma dairenensis CBS 421]CCD27246.1 hypothetical protein NDAI_0K00550 [Naumovozyma dairenensis CBS 421]
MAHTHSPLYHWNSCPGLLNTPEQQQQANGIAPIIPPSQITKIHIYDFDNTLFASPQPNKQLYTKNFHDRLGFGLGPKNAGPRWWLEPMFLRQAYNEFIQAALSEQTKPAQEGGLNNHPAGKVLFQYWNRDILELAAASIQDPSTISILMTGREDVAFSALIEYMITTTRDTFFNKDSPYLKFNAVVLKKKDGNFKSTMAFKQQCLSDLINHYSTSIKEITIYDDRPKQINQFKIFLNNLPYNPRLQWFVIPVPPISKRINPDKEYKILMLMVDKYNETLKGSFKRNKIEIRWTPKELGCYLTLESHAALLERTAEYLENKSIDMNSIRNLKQYPLGILLSKSGNIIPGNEMVSIYLNDNNSNKISLSSTDQRNILNKIYNPQNEEDLKKLVFIVHTIGIKRVTGNKVDIYFKASCANNYLFPTQKI